MSVIGVRDELAAQGVLGAGAGKMNAVLCKRECTVCVLRTLASFGAMSWRWKSVRAGAAQVNPDCVRMALNMEDLHIHLAPD